MKYWLGSYVLTWIEWYVYFIWLVGKIIRSKLLFKIVFILFYFLFKKGLPILWRNPRSTTFTIACSVLAVITLWLLVAAATHLLVRKCREIAVLEVFGSCNESEWLQVATGSYWIVKIGTVGCRDNSHTN